MAKNTVSKLGFLNAVISRDQANDKEREALVEVVSTVVAPVELKRKGRSSLYEQPLVRVLAFISTSTKQAMQEKDDRSFSIIIREMLEEKFGK